MKDRDESHTDGANSGEHLGKNKNPIIGEAEDWTEEGPRESRR